MKQPKSGKEQSALRGIKLAKPGSLEHAPANIFDDIQATIIGRNILPLMPDELGREVRETAVKLTDQPFLKTTFDLYRGKCECETEYVNNCAHFLTDAMVRAGLPKAFPASGAKCPKGRMIRAKETLDWFKTFSGGVHVGHDDLNSGYWFVYQENAGQGHVCVHLEASSGFSYRGTGDFSSVWPVNWHFFY